jgi:hypothetical protein
MPLTMSASDASMSSNPAESLPLVLNRPARLEAHSAVAFLRRLAYLLLQRHHRLCVRQHALRKRIDPLRSLPQQRPQRNVFAYAAASFLWLSADDSLLLLVFDLVICHYYNDGYHAAMVVGCFLQIPRLVMYSHQKPQTNRWT